MPDLLTEAEAAALLRRSRRHVRQLRQAGELAMDTRRGQGAAAHHP
jgi:hypothetical protein